MRRRRERLTRAQKRVGRTPAHKGAARADAEEGPPHELLQARVHVHRRLPHPPAAPQTSGGQKNEMPSGAEGSGSVERVTATPGDERGREAAPAVGATPFTERPLVREPQLLVSGYRPQPRAPALRGRPMH